MMMALPPRVPRPCLDFKPAPPTTHDALADDLALYLRCAKRPMMTWRNIQFNANDCIDFEWWMRMAKYWEKDGNGSVYTPKPHLGFKHFRPDVFALRCSVDQRNIKPIVYEVKVSRADFLSDVRSGKWRQYLSIASAVYFAAPDKLLSPKELPAGAGLIVRRKDHWRLAAGPAFGKWQPSDRFWLTLLVRGRDRMVWERAMARVATAQ